MNIKKYLLSIHFLTASLLAVALILIVISASSLSKISRLHKEENAIEYNNRETQLQVDIIMKASDYLTREVWRYITTRKPVYMHGYWNEINNAQRRENAIKRLRALGAEEEEIEYASEAKRMSDALAKKELWAMKLVVEASDIPKNQIPAEVASYKLSPEEEALPPYEKIDRAAQYIFGPIYNMQKQQIFGSVGKAHSLISARYKKIMAEATARTEEYMSCAILLNIMLFLPLMLVIAAYYILINRPTRNYSKALKELTAGSQVHFEPQGSYEMRAFANLVNNTFRDLRRQNAELQRMTETDYLTQILNRPTFEEYTGRLLREKKDIAVISVDIDTFKLFNDSFGRPAGDMALKKIAEILSSSVTNIGAAARTGGEEFVLAAAGITEKEEVTALADSILKKISETNMRTEGICPIDTYLTVTMGAAVSCGTYDSAAKLMGDADTAMTCAKESGRNCWRLFSPEDEYYKKIFAIRQNEAEFESQMWNSLRNGEFVPYFQPKYDMSTMKICSAEALVRWNHQTHGLLYPDSFMPFFERNGFVKEIDYFMYEQCCKMVRDYLASGRTIVPIAVNFSWRHLLDPGFADTLIRICRKYNVSPHYMEIEMTETSIIKNIGDSIEQIKKLRANGFSVAIDDFGCGYSSLSVIRDFPIDYLKIDKSFVNGDMTHASDIFIVRSILNLCNHLGIKPICEGIETEKQNKALKEWGCLIGQGYYFSKPIPRKEFDTFLSEHL